MWDVFETAKVTKSIPKLPKQVQMKYKAWVEVVKAGGSFNLRNFPGFKDEKLKGNLRNCRSSRLSILYRVIYQENNSVREITVISITANKYEDISI